MSAPFDADNVDIPLKEFEGTHPAVARANEVVKAVNALRVKASKKLPQGGGGGGGGTPFTLETHIDGVRHTVQLSALSAPQPVEEE